jgi:signal transduction histidine kinase
LAWTNPYHEWYWAEIDYAAAVPAGATSTPAPGFWGFVLFSYLLLLVGTVLFVRHALTAPHLYRGQTLALLVGMGVPWLANIPHALQWMAADLTPVALAVTVVSIWAAMFWYRLTDLSPIALRTVFESISTGVVVLDPQNRVVDVNAAGRTLLGLSAPVGTLLEDLPLSDDLHAHIRSGEPGRTILTGEAAPSPQAETPRHYEVRVTPIEGAQGHAAGRLVVIDDVTQQQERQRRLESQNEHLEAFTSVVSHDLRNPLNVAAGNLALAREAADGDYLERADRALDRMEALIDDLLALAHSGTAITDPAPVPLSDVVVDAWETVDTHGASLHSQTTRTLVADRSRLHQLIENLIRNAVEHGGDTATVVVGDHDKGFYVADDGPGIPPEEREAVFETGYSTRDAGTGFGLNIVEEIADAHGWEVRIAESAAGGARFDLTGVSFAEDTSSPTTQSLPAT